MRAPNGRGGTRAGSAVEDALDLQDTLQTYRRFAGSYDIVFGPLFHPGRKAAVRLVNDCPHQRILEVGVGTGLSLPYFRADARVVGIDVSTAMLAKARERVRRRRLAQVEALLEMNAEAMSFADDSFDAVLGLYVASVVPSPARLAAEIRRVCRPGGAIVIVNHFSSRGGVMRWIERHLAPFARQIGFHADFPLDGFLAASHLTVREIRPSNLFGYWKLLRCVNEK